MKDKVQIVLLAIGVITIFVVIEIGMLYSYHKTTYNLEQEIIAERNKELAEIRKQSFEECGD